MQCIATIQSLGFRCREKKNGTIQVLTPFTHVDGEPVYVYLKNNLSLITDNGSLLFFLIKTGRNIQQRINAFTAHAAQYELSLSRDGDFLAKIDSEQQLSAVFGRYLEFIGHFLSMEAETFTRKEENTNAIADVIAILKRRNQNIDLEVNPHVMGGSKQRYQFDIRANNTLIDVINPHGASTGASLRKAADILKATTDYTTLFVIDDRERFEAAEKEASIISSVSPVITYSSLAHGTSPLTVLH